MPLTTRLFAGFSVVIENPAGTLRKWTDGQGAITGSTLMLCDYGYLEGHGGADGDEVDVYLGPDEAAPFVFVVHQLAWPDFLAFDEDKVLLGFADEAAARAAYLAHRNDGERAYGGMTSMSVARFRAKLERREGTGKIRHEGAMTEAEQTAWIVANLSPALFDRGADGKVRSGLWDRGATPGTKLKDGAVSEFNAETFGEMIRNWVKRGEKLSLCYNHQSAFVEKNGQAAPALAFYDAAAIVEGGQVVAFAKLLSSSAARPDLSQLRLQVAALATTEVPIPSADGLWWYRCEVTEIGDKLLPGFRYLSPMFVPNGKDEFGQPQGYTIYDLAATNTAFQAGCLISFGQSATWVECPRCGAHYSSDQLRGGLIPAHRDIYDPTGGWCVSPDAEVRPVGMSTSRGVTTMAIREGDHIKDAATGRLGVVTDVSATEIQYDDSKGQRHSARPADVQPDPQRIGRKGAIEPSTSGVRAEGETMKMTAEMARRLGVSADADPATVKTAYARRMDDVRKCMAEDEKPPYEQLARHMEEEAKHYEDSYGYDEKNAEGPAMVMRKLAARALARSKMGAVEEKKPAETMAADEEKSEEKAKEQMGALAARLSITLPAGASSKQMMDAIQASSVPAANLPGLVQAQVTRVLAEQQDVAARAETAQRAEVLVTMAIQGGYPAELREQLKTFASDPKMYAAAEAMAKPFLPTGGPPALLMQRLTAGGAPVGVPEPRRMDVASGPDTKIYENPLGTFVVEGERFAAMAIEWADAKEGAAKKKIDAMCAEGEHDSPFKRLIYANELLKKERPDLWRAAEAPHLFGMERASQR